MKRTSLLAVVLFAASLAVPAFVMAGEEKPKEAPACGCAKSEDGKACGVDKDCCCTGEKAKKDKDKSAG
jgi:hypothetical protein